MTSVVEKHAGLTDRRTGTEIPLEGVSVEAEIVEGSVRTVVAQRYANRGSEPVEAVYVFPLDEGAAVCGFEAVAGGTVVRGKVEDRETAFEIYDDALAAGKSAFLLDEERPDVFTISVGNLPPGGEALIRITTVAEAPREGDGIRWVLPTTVSPRYAPAEDRQGVGRPPAELVNPPIEWTVPYGLELSVEVRMSSAIRTVESSSHPISVETDGCRATVRLGERRAALDRDFVLVVRSAEPETPKCVLEREADGTATTATSAAVKIVFPPLQAAGAAPGEVLFLVDRSGSMGGSSIGEARNALQLCLRSLPPGILFNVAGFGSRYESLFPKARAYSDETLAAADAWVRRMEADLGGTEILPALKKLLAGKPPAGGRAVFVLTDGEVSNVDAVLALVGKSAAGTRLFTFGIGAGASIALVRGMARVGRGACELIAPGERIEAKVMRQLGRALKGGLVDAAVEWGGLSARPAPARLTSVFAGEPTVVYAFLDRLEPATVVLKAEGASGPVSVPVRIEPSMAVEGSVVATLAARATIRDLEEGEWAAAGSRQKRGGADAASRRIVEIAKKYGLASRETSFVAVQERKDTMTGELKLVRIPTALTRGWGGVDMHAPFVVACASTGAFPAVLEMPSTSYGDRGARPLDRLVRLQRADGSWHLDEALAEAIGYEMEELERYLPGGSERSKQARAAFATLLVLELLERRWRKEAIEWRLLAEKARGWLAGLPASIPVAECETAAERFVEEVVVV